MTNNADKWENLKDAYPSEYKEWTALKSEQAALQLACTKGEINEAEFDSKNTNIELTLFLIEIAVGID